MEGLKPAMDALTGFGAAGPLIGLLVWLFWQERTERRELSGKLLDLSAKSIEAESEMTTALNALAGKIK